jgi:HEAT repeat protein
MVIRSSSAREVEGLVEELRSADPVRREGAVARLRVLGGRAHARIAALVRHDPQPSARLSGLRALDGVDDPRVADVGLRALTDADADVRVAAIAALRPWVLREDGTRVMDALVTTALDTGQDAPVRAAALDALAQLPSDLVRPIVERAALDPREPQVLESPAAAQEWRSIFR